MFQDSGVPTRPASMASGSTMPITKSPSCDSHGFVHTPSTDMKGSHMSTASMLDDTTSYEYVRKAN